MKTCWGVKMKRRGGEMRRKGEEIKKKEKKGEYQKIREISLCLKQN